MRTLTTYFSGGGLFDWGVRKAGYRTINCFEIDPAIAEVGQANTEGTYIVSDVCQVNPYRYEKPDHFHASPVCKNASVANPNAGESNLDKACAEAVALAIRTWRPETFSLENVYAYWNFEAFHIILNTLSRFGYGYNYWHLNSADYGTPQTRQRLILIARRDGYRPGRPPVTHTESPSDNGCLFGEPLKPWDGWYRAIEDLIDTLPESRFAEWQLRRLEELDLNRFGAWPRALLVDSKNAGQEWGCGRHGNEPSFTVTTINRPAHMPRALLLGDQYRQESWDHEPAMTVTANEKGGNPPRGLLESSRVVQMTPRALARFMGLDDAYQLSGNRKLDSTVLGNGVAVQVAEAVCRECAA